MQVEIVNSHDQQLIKVRYWAVEKPIAKMQILHGMAEHCDRYAEFAQYMQQHNIEVIAHNHRGHGERTPLGHFGAKQGWNNVLKDVATCQQVGNQQVPLIVFGHSMGSFIARDYLAKQKEFNPATTAHGAILSGSNQQHPALFHAAKLLSSVLVKLQGGFHPSQIMNFLSFSAFNKHFKPIRTEFDWLCSDEQVVDQYIQDRLCGNLSSLQFWQDFMGGMIKVHSQQGLNAIPDIPLLVLGGDKDPVGRMGKGFIELEKQLKHTQHQQVSLKLYSNARHELVNELNKQEIWQDICDWLQRNIVS